MAVFYTNRCRTPIRVENDKVFLLSLALMGEIKILEREDSFQLRPSNVVQLNKYCGNCGFGIKDVNESLLCPVYNAIVIPEDGTTCICWKSNDDKGNTKKTQTYIDIAKEHDLNKIIENYLA
jgi:hypothetical protein